MEMQTWTREAKWEKTCKMIRIWKQVSHLYSRCLLSLSHNVVTIYSTKNRTTNRSVAVSIPSSWRRFCCFFLLCWRDVFAIIAFLWFAHCSKFDPGGDGAWVAFKNFSLAWPRLFGSFAASSGHGRLWSLSSTFLGDPTVAPASGFPTFLFRGFLPLSSQETCCSSSPWHLGGYCLILCVGTRGFLRTIS